MPDESQRNLFRNVVLFAILILAVILYSKHSVIQKWWKESGLRSNSAQVAAVKGEPPQEKPIQADLPLDSKAAAVACGKTMKLDEAAFVKLDLVTRLAKLLIDSGITDEEAKAMGAKELDEQEFEAYSFGYITWDKASQISRAGFDKIVADAVNSVDESKLSPADRIQLDPLLVKVKRMMVKAFELGRQDAEKSPCPF